MTSVLQTSPNATRCRVANHLWVYKAPFSDSMGQISSRSFGLIPFHKPYTVEEIFQIKQANRGFIHAYDRT